MKQPIMVRTTESSNDPRRYSTAELPLPVKAIRYHFPVEICHDGRRTGLFHYCCCVYPGNVISPVGYCAQGCNGHSSKEAAREHYRQYLMDRYLHFDGRLASPGACGVCGQMTTRCASLDFHYEWEIVPLCVGHLNRDGFAGVFVLDDYHLLQVSDAQSKGVVTFAEQDAPICIVLPPQKSVAAPAASERGVLPPPQI